MKLLMPLVATQLPIKGGKYEYRYMDMVGHLEGVIPTITVKVKQAINPSPYMLPVKIPQLPLPIIGTSYASKTSLLRRLQAQTLSC